MTYLLFFFNDTATTEIYTLSLHDALPICVHRRIQVQEVEPEAIVAAAVDGEAAAQALRLRVDRPVRLGAQGLGEDRKSTRLNSSHANISYAVFCLKKKKKIPDLTHIYHQY